MCVRYPGEKRYEGVSLIISVTRGWVGVAYTGKQRYVTLEWPSLHSFNEKMKLYNELMCMIYVVHFF